MSWTIDGHQVFMSEQEPPAFTLSVNSITDPSKTQGIASTTIKAAASKELRQQLGTEYMTQSRPDARPVIEYGEDSVKLFRAEITQLRADRNEYELFAVSGNASWFDHAKDTKLREFDFGLTEIVDAALQRASWTDAEALVLFPLIDFGSFEAQPATTDVLPIKLRPATFVRRVLEEVFDAIGYRIRARGRFAEDWPKLYTIDPKATPSIQAPEPYPVSWDDVLNISHPDGVYFVPSTSGMGTVELVDFGIANDPFDTDFDGAQFKVTVFDFTTQTVLAEYLPPSRYFGDADFGAILIDHTFTNVPMVAGHEIGVGVQVVDTDGLTLAMYVPPNTSQVHYTLGAQNVELYAPVTAFYDLTDASNTTEYTAGTRLRINQVVPSMSAAELLMAVVNDKCLAIDTDTTTRTINLWYDQEFFRKPDPIKPWRDWSDRIDQTVPPAKKFNGGPRRITFEFKADADDRGIRRANRLSGLVGFANAVESFPFANGSETKVSIPFAPSYMGKALGGLTMPVIRTLGEVVLTDNYEREARILMYGGTVAGSWEHDGDSLTDYPLSYFGNASTKAVLAFGNGQGGAITNPGTVEIQWKRRMDSYRFAQLLEAHLFIRDHELQDFDHGLPTLVDDGSGPAWYWVQEIQQHRFGVHQPTKCLLVQIPGKEVAIVQPEQPAITYPDQPFACVGARYIAIEASGEFGVYMYTDDHFSLRLANGNIITSPSDTSTLATSASACFWPSDENGNLSTEEIRDVSLQGELTSVDASGFDGITITGVFDVSESTLTSFVIPSVIAASVQVINNPDMTDVTLPATVTYGGLYLNGNDLTAAAVNAVLANLRANGFTGTAQLDGGTNDAPTGQGIIDLAFLNSPPDVTVTGTGITDLDGAYDPTTVTNGRSSYIHQVNGVSSIYWTGSQWRLINGADIFDSYDNVLEPWLITTWILVSGSGSLPTVNPPGLGATVTTN